LRRRCENQLAKYYWAADWPITLADMFPQSEVWS